MEVEKPFKCSVCSSQFTNEDHLQVHNKRHEMSLNLSRSGLNLNGPDGFVDETPTPTRFIRNCEEVGLFQDLQNVNPFDEQFSKATGSTHSSDGFEFGFTSSSKKANDDTLNTPQVFGFTTTTTSVTSHKLTVTTSSSHSSGISTTLSPDETSNLEVCRKDLSLSSKSLSIACTAEEAKMESTTPDNESFIPQMFSLDCKSPLQLRLDLSSEANSFSDSFISGGITLPKIGDEQGITEISFEERDERDIPSQELPTATKTRKTVSKKAELLERNRAAASRSRERRKQWVSGLEQRCQTLQGLLSNAQTELSKLRGENNFLREELLKHANCDVTRCEPRSKLPSQRISEFQPQILKHSTASRQTATTSTTLITLPTTVTSPVVSSASSMVKSNPTIIPSKPKRGRPRKGCERRAEGISIPVCSTSSVVPKLPLQPPREAPLKVEILPVKTADGQPLTNVYILKRGP